MNIAAAGMVIEQTLEHGGLAMGHDIGVMISLFRSVYGETFEISKITDDQIASITRILSVMATVVQDPDSKADVITFVKSL